MKDLPNVSKGQHHPKLIMPLNLEPAQLSRMGFQLFWVPQWQSFCIGLLPRADSIPKVAYVKIMLLTFLSQMGTLFLRSPRICVLMTIIARNVDSVINIMFMQKYAPINTKYITRSVVIFDQHRKIHSLGISF